MSEDQTGTEISFLFDKEIFKEEIGYRYETLVNRFREMAFVTKRTKIHLVDEKDDKRPLLFSGRDQFFRSLFE
jgi:DNA gyrase subunit B